MRVEQRQQPVVLVGGEVAEEVGLLVGRHRVDQPARVGQLQLADDAGPVVLQLGLVEHPHRELEGKCGQDLRRRSRRQPAQRVGDVGGGQRAGHVGELVGIGGQQVEQLGCRLWRGDSGLRHGHSSRKDAKQREV